MDVISIKCIELIDNQGYPFCIKARILDCDVVYIEVKVAVIVVGVGTVKVKVYSLWSGNLNSAVQHKRF